MVRILYAMLLTLSTIAPSFGQGDLPRNQTGGTVPPTMVPASPNTAKDFSPTNSAEPGTISPSYVGVCGGAYVCQRGDFIDCTPSARPYEDVSHNQCYCWKDNC